MAQTVTHLFGPHSTRAGAIASKKIKNNLLAAVLILTVLPPDTKLGREAVEHCCFIISQKLNADDEVRFCRWHGKKDMFSHLSRFR
jgi:hypothetical protein